LDTNLTDGLEVSLIKLLDELNRKDVEICNISFSEDNDSKMKGHVFGSIEIDAKDKIEGIYRATTNLSTIKSQISKGRQLIQSMVAKKFKYLEDNGID